jgi:glutamyl-tRNA synthetase
VGRFEWFVCSFAHSDKFFLGSDFFQTILASNRSASYRHLVRWFNYLSSHPAFAKAKDLMNQGKKVVAKGTDEAALEDLKGAVIGKVCTRFPPEPSGYALFDFFC